MVTTMMLAHGGTVGGLFEAAFLIVPLVVFAILAWRTHRIEKDRRRRDEPRQGP